MKVLFEFAHETLLYWTQNESETKLAYWGSQLPVEDTHLDAAQRKAVEDCRVGRYTPIYSETWRTLDPESWMLQLLASGRLTELVWVTPEQETEPRFDFKLSEMRLGQILGVPLRRVTPEEAPDLLTHYDLSFAEAFGVGHLEHLSRQRLMVSCSIATGRVAPELREVAEQLVEGGVVGKASSLARGRRALFQENYEEALAELSRAAEESPPDAITCYWLEAEALLSLGRRQEAVQSLEQLFDDPRITRSMQLRVALRLAQELEDSGRVRVWIGKARGLDRKNPRALKLLAQCEEKDGELGRACKHWRQLARLYPDRLSTLEVYQQLVRLYEAQGKTSEAEEERRRLLRKQRAYRLECREELEIPLQGPVHR